MNSKIISFVLLLSVLLMFSCTSKKSDDQSVFTGKEGEVRLVVLNPGHFHASLLLKSNLARVNDSVFVYAPEGTELEQYLATVKGFNTRIENPTSWKEEVYEAPDFLEKMLAEKRGNVVVLAGNNHETTNYIYQAVSAGYNVLSDKPMAINKEDFQLLVKAYENAEKNNVLLYDMMTERFDDLNIIEKELINNKELFGELTGGTENEPAVYMESVHHFYKEVAGKPLIRPAWYYDVQQQGEGIADVTTHYIDLVNWKCFPDQSINYQTDIKVINASHWATELSLEDFSKSTNSESFPSYLLKYVENSKLKVNANGTINYQVKGKNIALKVLWNYVAPQGGGDTFTSRVIGTKAILATVQDKQHDYIKQLYVEKADGVNSDEFKSNLERTIENIKEKYPFVSLKEAGDKYQIVIPVENRSNHEAHFGLVAENYFDFLVNRNMPEWEKANTLTKYFITTTAVEMANE
ncbi:MAG: Gfo/Idh/MocA family oxidoreductase [Bacteroidales bacterium]|jgi:predicted dehydrogenase|nr:Gfo/Idh/MocA family oxidoreductase [Bacteroidales bacterium]